MIVTPILYMPEGYTIMSEGSKKNVCNGCDFDGVSMSIWGLKVDKAYSICNYMYHFSEATIEAKEEADRVFLNNLVRIINRNTNRFLINFGCIKIRNPLLWLRRRAAYSYYDKMKKFGGPAFWSGKNDSKNLGRGV